MGKYFLKTMVAAIGIISCMSASAQEVKTYVPLQITSGLNRDVISNTQNNLSGTSTSGGFDSDFIFYGKAVNSGTGAIDYSGYYLNGNTDGIKYYMESAKNTQDNSNNVVYIANANEAHDITFSTMGYEFPVGGSQTSNTWGSSVPYAKNFYLLATAGGGSARLKIELMNNTDVLKTQYVTLADWSASNTSEETPNVYSLGRVRTTDNFFQQGFCLRRITVSAGTSKPITGIRITRETVQEGSNEYKNGKVAIFAITAETDVLTYDESQTSFDFLKGVSAGNKTYLKIYRTFKEGWNVFSFPYALSANQVKELFGENAEIYHLEGGKAYSDGHLTFTKLDEGWGLSANHAYLVKGITLKDDNTYAVSNFNYTSAPSATLPWADLGGGMHVLFANVKQSTFDNELGYYAMSGGKFYHFTDKKDIKAFRYFIVPQSVYPTPSPSDLPASIDLLFTDAPTGIGTVTAKDEPATGNVYTFDGRLVRTGATSTEGLSKGLYIINHKKVVVK